MMFNKSQDILISRSPSAINNNLTLITLENKVRLAFAHKNSVNILSFTNFDERVEFIHQMNDDVIQIKFVALDNCKVLVVTDRNTIKIFDAKSHILLATSDFLKTFPPELNRFAKGITAFQDTFICIGTFDGSILIASISQRTKNLEFTGIVKTHKQKIVDLCVLQDKLVSIDTSGVMIIWDKEQDTLKTIHESSIPEKYPCTCLRAWHNFLIIGTANGKILIGLTNTNSDWKIPDICVNAHARIITAMDIDESGLLASVSEDSYIRVWKLMEKDLPIVYEWCFKESGSLLYGIHFLNINENADKNFLLALAYDKTRIFKFEKS